MSEHDSFLRLISQRDGPAEDPKENSLPEISDASSRATEWDLEEHQQIEAPANIPAEEAINFGVEDDWAERAIEQAQSEDPAAEFSEKLFDTREVTRTEVAEKTKTETDNLRDQAEVTRTVNYSREEALSFASHVADPAERVAPESSRVGTKSVRLGMEDEVPAEHLQKTNATMPFDGDNKTAAFNYDEGEEEAGSRIVVLEGKANTKAVHLVQFPIRIGRDQANELILDDVNVSRFHAEIRRVNGMIKAVDLGSTNGIKVNGQAVVEQDLSANDVVQIGDCLLEFLPAGMLSQGAPKAGAFQATVSRTAPPRRRKILTTVSVVVILVAAGFLMFSNREQIENNAAQIAKKVTAEKAGQEIEQMKQTLETKFQKKVEEIPPADLKKVFLERFDSSKIAALVPIGVRESLTKLPPVAFKLFLSDPKMISEILERGANIQALDYVLRDRLNVAIRSGQLVDALALAEFLLSVNPEDQSLKRAVKELSGHVKNQAADNGSTGYQNLSPEEKKFYEYVDTYDRNHEELMLEKRYPQALAFAKLVRQKLSDLIRLEPSFEKLTRPEMEKWDRRIAQIETKVKSVKRDEEQVAEKQALADKELTSIKLHLDIGDVATARNEIENFLKKYPDHPQVLEVLQLKKDMELGVERSFATIRTNVERFLKTESYENAWGELYKFLDLMPAYSPAVELKNTIDQSTHPKASQFYNQARVYEYEADDLIAAEQYYKRAMEAADPRSDLSKKAGRRYAEVKRKLIH
jgi:pSer/pThr/pTyr-binding forkhead associated (FHA) protein